MRAFIRNRRLLFSAAAIGGIVTVALWPTPVAVELATVSRGPLVVTVDEEGRTRVRDRFIVTAPVSGRVLRIELEPGDPVTRGSIVARLQPAAPALLDARTRAEAIAAVKSAEATLGFATAEEQRAQAALAQAQRELTRSRQLATAGAIAAQQLDALVTDVSVAAEAVRATEFAVRAAAADLERTRARGTESLRVTGSGAVAVVAPVDGVVLQRLRESETIVPAGEPLIEIADPRQLEVVTDLLSADAAVVRPGSRATIEQWGGEALNARVRRIEPAGFTKVSALGVEEQRVNVILDLPDVDDEAGVLLGDAFRVETRIVLWEASNVLKVPTNALFRSDGRWAVYLADNGRARLAIIQLGHQTPQEAEVISGVAAGALVIVHPGDLVRDGARIADREHR
jgi:HlyD family secretion protein